MSVGNRTALGSPESVTESVSYQYVERRAWMIVIGAFVAYCLLAAALLYGVRWFLFESETTQQTSVTWISGTVFFIPPGAVLPQAIVQSANGLAENTRIDTEPGSQAAVKFYAPDASGQETVLGSMQVYGSSTINLELFRSPRFGWSQRPHRMVITMQRGRARVNLAVDVTRQTVILLQTPHGDVVLERSGSYAIEVTNQATEVVVRDGAATVTGAGQRVILAPNERTRVRTGQPPEGVLTGQRNMILNGDFASTFSPADWNAYFDPGNPDDAIGSVTALVESGRNAVHFVRPGAGWGRVGIQQRINRDVRDYQSLKLHLALKIVRQNVLVCGTYGSECPVMVRIDFTNQAGNPNKWVMGFYYLGDASNTLPTLCITCEGPKKDHVRVPQNEWYLYDSDDLIALLNEPAIINSIAVYAEGHTFESLVSEIELLAGD